MTTTNNLGITLVEQSQAQKEVTVNEAISVLEALQNRGVEDVNLATPPVSPSAGAAYIIAASGTGAWAGKDGKIAYFNAVWKFITPREGLLIWVNDEDTLYYFSGSAWLKYSDNLNNISKLGINATADATNKLAVNSDAILFNNNGTNVQVKLNKNAVGNSGSFLFQTGFSGRAEIGLTGDDDFHFKVSPNGSSYVEALTLDKTTGAITVAGGAKILCGTGTPEGSKTAPIGSIYLRTDGGAGTSFYVKQSGTGNTGWAGK
jgi:hypothetical protein